MTSRTANPQFKASITGFIKNVLFYAPLVVGVFHQFLMWVFGIDRIYVFLNPPGYIYPFVTLETGWWLVLTLGMSLLTFLAFTNRLRPHRIAYPFYLYLILLLILVKPI